MKKKKIHKIVEITKAELKAVDLYRNQLIDSVEHMKPVKNSFDTEFGYRMAQIDFLTMLRKDGIHAQNT